MNDLVFSLIQVNDIHLALGEDPRNTQGKLAALVQDVGISQGLPQPDLLLFAGDLVDTPDAPSFERFLEIIDPLAVSTLISVPGNHDIALPDEPGVDSPYARIMNTDTTGEVFRFRGVTFLLINDAAGDQRRTTLTETRNRWLEAQLAGADEGPVIVVAHVPLIAMRDPGPLAVSFDFPTWRNQDPDRELLHIVERYADRVVAVLGGHLHLTARVERGGIEHIVPSGLMSWPHDVAYLEFFPNRIDVRMLSVRAADPGELGRWPLRNGVHDRHGREFIDSRHPTFEQYVKGLPEERAFSIPLEGRKQIRPNSF